MILGFDPRYQFVHEDDVVNALLHAALHDLPGIFNVAGDGVLAFTEVCSLLGKQFLPVLPPWGTGMAAQALRRFGVVIPPEMLAQLRFGRGLDNRRFKATGFGYRYTTRETVQKLGEHLRLQPILAGVREPYRYEREVEEFLRWSPYVRRGREDGEAPPMPNLHQLSELQKFLSSYAGAAPTPGERVPVEEPEREPLAAREPEPVAVSEPEPAVQLSVSAPVDDYDDLEPEEVISLLGSLEGKDLVALRAYEEARQGREGVLRAIDGVLARREPAGTR
jgi:UDP-glucose 4-epimerase